MDRKKVWIFHPDSSDPSMGGLQRPYNLAKYLNEEYEITVFASSQFRQAKSNLIQDDKLFKYIEGEVPFYYVKSHSYEKNDKNRILNWISYYKNVKKLSKLLIRKKGKPDIIMGSSPHPLAMLAAVKIGKKHKIPIINEIRDYWPEVFFLGGRIKEKSAIGKILLSGEKYIYDNSDSLIFLKEGDYKYILDRKWDKGQGGKIDLNDCYYINNGVDLDQYNKNIKKNIIEDEDLESSMFNVIYVGGLRKVNNLDKVLDAAKLITDKKVQFLIYGNGDHQKFLENRIKKENINNVKLKGHVDNKYIPYTLSKSDINLLNYSQNNYNWSRGNSSNKLFEYMASGKPIISTVKMGYSIIEKYNCGIELESEDPKELITAIEYFKNLPEEEIKKIGINGKNGAKDFDYQNLSNKFSKVIENTIGGEND